MDNIVEYTGDFTPGQKFEWLKYVSKNLTIEGNNVSVSDDYSSSCRAQFVFRLCRSSSEEIYLTRSTDYDTAKFYVKQSETARLNKVLEDRDMEIVVASDNEGEFSVGFVRKGYGGAMSYLCENPGTLYYPAEDASMNIIKRVSKVEEL